MPVTIIGQFLNALSASYSAISLFDRLGKKRLIRELDELRRTIEQFKEAAEADDKSAIAQTFHQYFAQMLSFQHRLLKGLDKASEENLMDALGRHVTEVENGFVAKRGMFIEQKLLEPKSGLFVPSVKASRTKLKRADLEELKLRLDIAIGTIRGLTASLRASVTNDDKSSFSSSKKVVKKVLKPRTKRQ